MIDIMLLVCKFLCLFFFLGFCVKLLIFFFDKLVIELLGCLYCVKIGKMCF